MASVYYDVQRRGGIARTYELLRDGHTSHRLTAAVRCGEVIRVRQGHYACPELADEQQRAVRIGGRLTGLAGARSHGIWTPGASLLEVSVPTDARALRTARDPRSRLSAHPDPAVRVRWTDGGARGTRAVLEVAECLRAIVRDQPPIVAFAAIESALRLGLINRKTARALGLTRHAKALSRLSESGGESLLKFRLLTRRIAFRQQVRIAGVGRVDFLVGARLVIEVDGAEFHTSREAFEEDRRRDAVLAALGYRVLRFSYRQVEQRWPEVSAAIAAVVASGEHQW
ncbi:MAG: hypothetical protein JWP85_2206 [Rhodoglobus sp.]|nr:hypothetical protein [Rhodoglobus sp.]